MVSRKFMGLVLGVTALLVIAVYILSRAWLGASSDLAAQKTKADGCETSHAALSAKAGELSTQLEAKTKAFDAKRLESCWVDVDMKIPEAVRNEVTTKNAAAHEALDQEARDVLGIVDTVRSFQDFPVHPSGDPFGYELLDIEVSGMEEKTYVCADSCEGARFSSKTLSRQVYIPMSLGFWALFALHNFNDLDFSNSEDPPDAQDFLWQQYDGDHKHDEDDPWRKKLLSVMEDPELVRTYGEWFVTFVKTAKPFKGSAGRGAKLWLVEAWNGSWAPFELIQKQLKENEMLLAIRYTESGYSAFDGWFYRRWKNTGGKPGGKDGKDGMVLITEYRRLLITLAEALGMPSYVPVWQAQLDSGKGPSRGEEEAEEEEEGEAEAEEDEDEDGAKPDAEQPEAEKPAEDGDEDED